MSSTSTPNLSNQSVTSAQMSDRRTPERLYGYPPIRGLNPVGLGTRTGTATRQPGETDEGGRPPRGIPFMTSTVAFARQREDRSHPRRAMRRDADLESDNNPSPYEAILLAPGEQKIEVEVDTRLPSAAIFTFHKEDHTLANMLRSRLLKTAHVTFAAYKVPHPLTPNFILRVQTDGTVTPRDAVINACEALIKDLGILSRNFTREYELCKMAKAANQQQKNMGE